MNKIVLFALGAAWAAIGAHATAPYLDDTLPPQVRIEDALARMSLDEKIAMIHAQSKFSTPGCPRLGIPEVWMSDGPHGVRQEIDWDDWRWAGWTNDSCTAMPALTCLAATFDPQLAAEYGRVVGAEARYRKKDVLLGPGVNIYRTPLSGRNFEYMGEDPLLSARMVVPYIRGVQQQGVAACVKHFALNNQEDNRNGINVNVDDRTLNELYLPAFKAAVCQGGAWAVMGSYNKYKNTHCTHNDTLVNHILKGQWGFDGVFITDWGSAHDTREAALNGLDMEMGSWTNGLTWGQSNAYDNYYMASPLKQMVLAGEIDPAIVDDKVRRVLLLNLRTNMNRRRPWGALNAPSHRATARKIAGAGIVLLKNEHGLLPVKEGTRVAVIGENAVKCLTLGGGSSELKPKVEISPLQGLTARLGAHRVSYSMGYASGEPDYNRQLPSTLDADSLRTAAVAAARHADMVIYIGGLNKNYRQDCEGEDRLSYNLPFGQDALIEALADANPNIAVVLLGGNAVAMPWGAKVPAIVQAWYLGSMAGDALADVLSGDVCPSGKLPFSIPCRLEDCAAHAATVLRYPGVDGQVYYDEGLLAGYRWHDTMGIKARFPFGHGLSYTTFKYGRAKCNAKRYATGDTIHIEIPVTNTGACAGAETVQAYAKQHHPRLPRPAKELKGFDKVHLSPGATASAIIDIAVADLGYYDPAVGTFVTDPGKYTLYLGSSSTDLRADITIEITDQLAYK